MPPTQPWEAGPNQVLAGPPSGTADGQAGFRALLTADLPVGYKIVRGEIALDGTNPTPVATGLTSIASVQLTMKKATAPGVGTSIVTYDTTGGTLNIYGWKVTSSSDTTLVASTGTETIGYTVIGTA